MTNQLLLLLFLALLIIVSKGAGHLCQRYLNQPVVFGEILAGLLLGPTLFNVFGWPVFAHSATWLHEMVTSLADIGVLLLMCIAGLETNLGQMRRVGKVAFTSAALGVLLPLGLGMLTAHLFGFSLTESLFIGVVLTATSVSISAQTLMEISQLRSKEGTVIMGAAVIDDVLGIIILSLTIAFAVTKGTESTHTSIADLFSHQLCQALHVTRGGECVTIGMNLVLMALFFALAVLLGYRAFPKILHFVDRLHASHAIPAMALVLIFLFAVGAEYIGHVAAITGAYLVGLFLARTKFREEIERGIHPFTYALFVPVFFMSIGLSANARELAGGSWLFVGVIILVAILAKIIGCGLGARLTGFTTPEALRVGIGMVSRGEVGLIVAQVGLAATIIGPGEYATMVLMVLATTVITPILLRLSFPRVTEIQTEVYESIVGIEGEEDQCVGGS